MWGGGADEDDGEHAHNERSRRRKGVVYWTVLSEVARHKVLTTKKEKEDNGADQVDGGEASDDARGKTNESDGGLAHNERS